MKHFPKTQEKKSNALCYKIISLLSNKIIIINYMSIKLGFSATLWQWEGDRMQSVIRPSSKAIFVLKALTRAEIEVLR